MVTKRKDTKMKKTIVFSLMAASLMFSACSSDSNGIADDEPQKKKGMKLNAVVPQNLSSRASIGDTENDTWTFAFTNGDQAKVINSNMSSYYTFTKSAEEFSSSEAKPTSSPAYWYAYFPSTNIDLTAQSGNVADVANKFALAGKTSSATTGEKGLTIHMDAKVAVLVIDNQKGAIDINIKNSATTWVKGLAAKTGEAAFDVTTNTTKTSILTTTTKGKYYIAVPAGVQLAIKNGDEVIKSTVPEGLEAGMYYKIELKEVLTYGCPDGDHPHMIEIGGVKWACMNVGATTPAGSPATCYGDYFAWGETKPRYTGMTITSASTATFSGWKSEFSDGYWGIPDYTGSELDAEHDAATVNWGDTWRTPSPGKFIALYQACGGTGTSINTTLPIGTSSTTSKGIYWCDDYYGIKGLLFCNGINKIFFPAAGYIIRDTYYYAGECGSYWESLTYGNGWYGRYKFYFDKTYVDTNTYYHEFTGYTVRPVSD